MALRTVMIFPELSGMRAIDALRRRYDPLAALVRPHITLVFPFESGMSDDELADILSQAAKDVAPFALRLQGFSEETGERYLFLNVTKGAGPLALLHDRLYAGRLAPFDAGRAYVPHMTVGHLPDARALHAAHAQASRCTRAFDADVTHIYAERIGENGESIVILEQALRGRKTKE